MFEKRTKRKWHGRWNNFQTVFIRNGLTLVRKKEEWSWEQLEPSSTRVSFILMFGLVAPKEWPICIYYAISSGTS